VTHVLSHRRLTVDVHVGTLSSDPFGANLPPVYETADLFDLRSKAIQGQAGAIGLAALARKVLAVAGAALE
jgi:hypothetical protein